MGLSLWVCRMTENHLRMLFESRWGWMNNDNFSDLRVSHVVFFVIVRLPEKVTLEESKHFVYNTPG